jgi:hypothetical protein
MAESIDGTTDGALAARFAGAGHDEGKETTEDAAPQPLGDATHVAASEHQK